MCDEVETLDDLRNWYSNKMTHNMHNRRRYTIQQQIFIENIRIILNIIQSAII